MLYKVAFRNTLRNSRRSTVTAFTVAVGTAGLFLFQAFNVGIMVGSREMTVHGKYGHGQVTTLGYRDKVLEDPWKSWIQNGEETAQRLAQVPGVTGVYPRSEFFALISNGSTSLGGRGIGVNGAKEAEFFHAMRMIEGEPLGDDIDGIVIGKGLARALGVKPGDSIMVLGNTVRGSINGLDLIVKGIFEIGLREIDDSLFQIQLERAQELLDTPSVEYFALGVENFEIWDEVEKNIEATMPELEATSFAVLDKVWYQHTIDWLSEQFITIRFIILTIVLLGIFNSTSTAILERTRELGMLRANGESIFDIIVMLVMEGGIIAGFGGLVGVTTVILLNLSLLKNGIRMPPPPGYTEVTPVFLELSASVAFTAFIFASSAAIIATLVAGQKVARMPIADALRAT